MAWEQFPIDGFLAFLRVEECWVERERKLMVCKSRHDGLYYYAALWPETKIDMRAPCRSREWAQALAESL